MKKCAHVLLIIDAQKFLLIVFLCLCLYFLHSYPCTESHIALWKFVIKDSNRFAFKQSDFTIPLIEDYTGRQEKSCLISYKKQEGIPSQKKQQEFLGRSFSQRCQLLEVAVACDALCRL